jgi:methylmalonyl-CoA/ethylmalonyl-CoA epimerase
MKFHHIGIATKNLKTSLEFLQKNFEVISFSQEIYDEKQNATLQMIKTREVNIELVTGPVVEKLIKAKTSYYHICYEVEDIHKAIEEFQGAILVSSPKEAILFNNRLVAFLMTPLGLVELLNAN